MTFDVDAAAVRHCTEKVGEPNYWSDCLACGQRWPCDAAQALDVIRKYGNALAVIRGMQPNTPAGKTAARALDAQADTP